MEATAKQKQLIHINTPNDDMKEEYVQWATEDNKKTSCNDLDFDQANKILERLGLKPQYKSELLFDNKNPKHRVIMSLLHQADWTIERNGQHFADINRLNRFLLNNERSPVKKKLINMTPTELNKLITAFTNIADFENK